MKPIISLSFDDGRLDNYKVFKEILEPNHIPVTINIATGFIENKCTVGSQVKPLTISQIQEMSASPLVEFACHGHMHKNEIKDIEAGRLKLAKWISSSPRNKLGFASPGSNMTPDYIRSHKN